MKSIDFWLDPAFWEYLLKRTVEWAVRTLPAVLLVLLLTFVLLKTLSFTSARIRARLSARSQHAETAAAREQEKRIRTLLGLLKTVGKVAIWIMAVMLILVQLGINVGPLIAGAGIVGLAIGFGAQELVRDVISGFFLLLEDQIRTGDVAIINGTGGLVETIGLRTVCLRDSAGVVHIFQNGKINTLSNMTKEWSAIEFDVGVAYKEDTDEVVQVMQEIGDALQADEPFKDKILAPLEIFGVEAFNDNAVVIKARFKTLPSEQWTVGREYRRRLKKAFDARGIEMPFPHRAITWSEASRPLKVDAALTQASTALASGACIQGTTLQAESRAGDLQPAPPRRAQEGEQNRPA